MPKSKLNSCKRCEHEHDSAMEYCGTCDSITPNWSEARWIKDDKIKKSIRTLEQIKDMLFPLTGVNGIIKNKIDETLKELEA